MIITEVRYEIVTFPEWQMKPTYRRLPGGAWEIERWSFFAEDYYWALLENAELERMLEEEYQKTKGG